MNDLIKSLRFEKLIWKAPKILQSVSNSEKLKQVEKIRHVFHALISKHECFLKPVCKTIISYFLQRKNNSNALNKSNVLKKGAHMLFHWERVYKEWLEESEKTKGQNDLPKKARFSEVLFGSGHDLKVLKSVQNWGVLGFKCNFLESKAGNRN